MIDAPFRKVLPRFSGPLIAFYGRIGASPNQITVAGFGVAVAAAGAVASGSNLAALLLWWVSRLLDGTDGIYARATGRVSELGGFLDIVLDMASYGAIVLGFAYSHAELTPLWLITLYLYVLCITGALALGALERHRGTGRPDNRTLRLASGLAEGGETGIAYSLFLLFPAYLGVLATIWAGVLGLTVVARVILAMRFLGPESRAAGAAEAVPARLTVL